MPEINKTLFRKVRNKILQFPESYNQGTYASRSRKAPCGTQACLFGWAALLTDEREMRTLLKLFNNGDYDFYIAGKNALGLTESQANVVANASGNLWPEPFRFAFQAADTKEQKSRVAADYINWILKNNRVK